MLRRRHAELTARDADRSRLTKVASTARREQPSTRTARTRVSGKTRMLRECTPEGHTAGLAKYPLFEFKHKILDHLCVAEQHALIGSYERLRRSVKV
jgi:hypothetical protein